MNYEDGMDLKKEDINPIEVPASAKPLVKDRNKFVQTVSDILLNPKHDKLLQAFYEKVISRRKDAKGDKTQMPSTMGFIPNQIEPYDYYLPKEFSTKQIDINEIFWAFIF